MPVEHQPFGALADGRPVELISLRNASGFEARVATYGATLVQLYAPDRKGDRADVVLGFDEVSGYLGEHPYFGSLIGRYANRIRNGLFTLDGRTYQLPRNDGLHHLHGGPDGFHRALWTARSKGAAEDAVALTYSSARDEQGYPGQLDVEVTYSLTCANALRIDYVASTDAPTIVNLTNHAYFNLAAAGTIEGHRLRVGASHFLPVDRTLVPHGILQAVDGTPFDFRAPARIGERIAHRHEQIEHAGGFDHTWVLDECSLDVPAAELYDASSGRVMTICTTQPGLQFYSGNFLDGSLPGKHAKAYPRRAGLCLETQHFPDSPNQPAFPSTVLRPGETYRHTTVYSFSVRS